MRLFRTFEEQGQKSKENSSKGILAIEETAFEGL